MHRSFAVLLALVCAFLAPASAAEVSTFTPIEMRPYVQPGVLQRITIDGFDPALGTLTSVRVDLDMHENGSARGENEAPGSAQLFWQSRAGLRLAAAGNVTLFAQSFPPQLVFRECGAFDGSLDYGGTSGFTQRFKTQTLFLSAYVTSDPVEMQRFVGAGPRPFMIERTGANLFQADSGETTAWLTHRVGGRLEVVFTYTPVAAP